MDFYRDGLRQIIDSAPRVFNTREGHVVEQYLVNGEKKYFVTLSGLPYCAHGSTLQEAISDAVWKDESKRPSLDSLKEEIQKTGKDRLISLNEFKLLTGACSEGCRVALKRKGLDGSPMLPKDIIGNFPEWGGKLYDILEWKL